MARSNNNLNAVLKDTADAIRVKKGTSEPIIPRDFADEIESIQSGGGDEVYRLLTNDDTINFQIPNEVGIQKELRPAFMQANIMNLDLKNAKVIPPLCFKSAITTNIQASNVCIIKEQAFASCYLKNINLNSEYFELETYCFSYCRNLESFNAEWLNFSGIGVFANCAKLKTVNFSCLSIPQGCFQFCYNLSYAELFFLGSSAYQFNSCSSLREVRATFASQIGSYQFWGCSNLTSLNCEYFITACSPSAFAGCEKLNEFVAPGCNYIGSCVFQNCYSLSYGIFGGSQIEQSAFLNCQNLESLYILNGSVGILRNVNAFSNTPMSNEALLGRFGSIYVPSSLVASYKAATTWATYSDRITALPSEFENRYIFMSEFFRDTTITTIPSNKLNAEFVGSWAFSGCVNLSGNISLPSCKTIEFWAFKDCHTTELYLPNCEKIDGAFNGCSSLTSVNLPALKVLDNGAFNSCYNLETIECPELLYLGNQIFTYCSKLSYLSFPKVLAVYGCTGDKVESVSLPECRWFWMQACPMLSSLYLPKAKFIKLDSGKISVFEHKSCVHLGGFNCSSFLTEVSFPNVITIDGGFAGCYNLSKVYLPNCVFINSVAFRACTSLTKLKLPKVQEIASQYAFSGCTHLSKILLGALENIKGTSVFLNCSALNSLYIFNKGLAITEYSNIFVNTPITDSSYLGHYGSIYVPAQLVSFYQQDNNWSYFSDRFVGMTDEEMQYVIDHWDD